MGRELADLTLADVNRVIRENLAIANVRYAFVTRDADDLQQRLEGNRASPITYEADKPAELLAEDKVIANQSLGLAPGNVRVVPAEQVFGGGG